jgi:hypothetical protein
MMKRILIGAPVRQDHLTFYKYLKALNQLDTKGCQVDFFFILHNSPRLKRFLKPSQYIEFQSENEYIRDEETHHWTGENLKDVAKMKNALLRYTLEKKYDYFFLVDSDLILLPQTLQTLLSHKQEIVAEVFWTQWTPEADEQPNAWMFDFYSFTYDRQYEQFRNKGLHLVGMSGACILIKSEVIRAGVNYSPIYNVSHSLWEDRAFCIRAAVHGYKIYLDTTCPPEHLYRQKPIAPSNNRAKQSHLRK